MVCLIIAVAEYMISAPCFSLLVQGEPWLPAGEMTTAQKECFNVASYLDVTAIVGHDATKDRFMQELATSTVIHIGASMYDDFCKTNLVCIKASHFFLNT